jgi:hypothetical protein
VALMTRWKIGDPSCELEGAVLELAVLDYFLRPFNEVVLKKSNFNVDVKERLTDRYLIVLIAMTCAESFYKRPSSCILDQSSSSGELFRDFMHGNTILSLDDDELRKLSALFARMGLKKVFTRESGA